MPYSVRHAMKKLIMKLLLALWAVALSLVAIEIVLRLMSDRTPNPLADRSRTFYDQAISRMSPWARGETNVLRIAVIGDSFTRGVGVQMDDRYGDRIERMLNMNEGPLPARVTVYGRSGSTSFQQIGMLRHALERKPDIVILGICINDTEDWTRPGEIRAWRDEWMPGELSGFQALCVRHSRVAAFVVERMRAMRSLQGCIHYYRHIYDPDYSGVARFRNSLEIFRDECAARGAVFVPVILPYLSFDFSPGRYPLQFAHDHIHEICDGLGVEYIDLLPAFRGTRPDRMQVIPGIDPHPSEIAHRIAAEAIVDYLLEHRHLDAAYRPKERRSSQPLHESWLRTIARFQAGVPQVHDDGGD